MNNFNDLATQKQKQQKSRDLKCKPLSGGAAIKIKTRPSNYMYTAYTAI